MSKVALTGVLTILAEGACGANQSCVAPESYMERSHACLCPKLLHVWSVGRPADCSDCSSGDACGGATFGASRGLLVTMDDGSEQSECVCQCTRLFSGLSCNVSLTKHLPVSPEAGIGITLGAVAAVGVVMACLLCHGRPRAELAETKAKRMLLVEFADWALPPGELTETKAKRMLFIEFADWALDWLTFGLAFYAADLRFHNDPDHIMRDFIMALCVLSTASWLFEIVLFCACKNVFLNLGQRFNFAHLLLEDGTQVVLYSIVASGNASSGTEDNTMQVIIVIAAGIQSLLFFLFKGYELFSEQRENGGNWGSGRIDPKHSRSRTSPHRV